MSIRETVARQSWWPDVAPGRWTRAVGYTAVGASGIPVDMLATNTVAGLGGHYLVATVAGYLLALTWNFSLQRRYVFDGGEAIIPEYLNYIAVDGVAAALRIGVVVSLLQGVSRETAILATRTGRLVPLLDGGSIAPVTVASLAGIAVASAVGFLLTDTFVFGGTA